MRLAGTPARHVSTMAPYARLAPTAALDGRRGEPSAPGLRHVRRYLAGGRRQAPVVAPRPDEVARLLLEQAAQGVLDGLPHQLAV